MPTIFWLFNGSQKVEQQDIDLCNFRFQLTLLREGGKFLLGTNATGGQWTLILKFFNTSAENGK